MKSFCNVYPLVPKLMGQLTLTCGKWIYQETRWLFGVDKKKERKVIEVSDMICYEVFVQMVIREYKVDTQNSKVELSYMYPRKVLLTLPQNTPPIYRYRKSKTIFWIFGATKDRTYENLSRT